MAWICGSQYCANSAGCDLSIHFLHFIRKTAKKCAVQCENVCFNIKEVVIFIYLHLFLKVFVTIKRLLPSSDAESIGVSQRNGEMDQLSHRESLV